MRAKQDQMNTLRPLRAQQRPQSKTPSSIYWPALLSSISGWLHHRQSQPHLNPSMHWPPKPWQFACHFFQLWCNSTPLHFILHKRSWPCSVSDFWCNNCGRDARACTNAARSLQQTQSQDIALLMLVCQSRAYSCCTENTETSRAQSKPGGGWPLKQDTRKPVKLQQNWGPKHKTDGDEGGGVVNVLISHLHFSFYQCVDNPFAFFPFINMLIIHLHFSFYQHW